MSQHVFEVWTSFNLHVLSKMLYELCRNYIVDIFILTHNFWAEKYLAAQHFHNHSCVILSLRYLQGSTINAYS